MTNLPVGLTYHFVGKFLISAKKIVTFGNEGLQKNSTSHDFEHDIFHIKRDHLISLMICRKIDISRPLY